MTPASQVAVCARELAQRGLSVASTGNVSLRDGDTVWITRSGASSAQIEANDVVAVDLDGKVLSGQGRPSSEWQLHTEVYRRRPQVNAIVHCHSRHATALACQRRELPPFHYMVTALGGRCVPCCDYATFGTEQLALLVADCLGQQFNACLLANHGQLTLGPDLTQALARAELLEELAATLLSAEAVAPVTLLSDTELSDAEAQFHGYGHWRES